MFVVLAVMDFLVFNKLLCKTKHQLDKILFKIHKIA